MDVHVEAEVLEEEVLEEEPAASADFPWVLFSINDVVYAVFSAHVLSIEILSDTTPLVNSPAYVRGITNFRGDMISLIDMRSLFGLPDRNLELDEQIRPYIAAHENWVSTLEECVRERKPFTLATDPHQCAFGKWYYSFETLNSTLEMYLKRIEFPHTRLHGTAGRIIELMDENKYDEIDTLMSKEIYPAFTETIGLLRGITEVYAEGARDMVVVLEVNGVVKGIIVDDIVSVEYINRILEMEGLDEKTEFIVRLGKREKDNSTVQMIDEEKIITL
ncbi:MAG: chemotaxis protein CheW [Oscillospiraceae bacterium]|nr:chemotaxis protein CheW [Oscillospiraceae bacterium]